MRTTTTTMMTTTTTRALRCRLCGSDWRGERCEICGSDHFVNVADFYPWIAKGTAPPPRTVDAPL